MASLEENQLLLVQDLLNELVNVKSVDVLARSLREIFIKGGSNVNDLEGYDIHGKGHDLWPFSGLSIYLTNYTTQNEREDFFDRILPFIASMAGNMINYLSDGDILLQRQEDSVQFPYHVVVSLLACHFLGALSFSKDHNFIEIFGKFNGQCDHHALASKLRCVIQFFNRLSVHDDIWWSSRVVTFSKKEIHHKHADLDTWLNNKSPLCLVKVDDNNYITDIDSGTIQFNFVSDCQKHDNQLVRSRCKQGSPAWLVYPELLIAQSILQDVCINEAVITKKDCWNNIHAVTSGIPLHCLKFYDHKQIICDELNKTWAGVSSCITRVPCTTSKENNSEKNQRNKSNISALVDMQESLVQKGCLSDCSNKHTPMSNMVTVSTSVITSYSELLSKFLVKKAIHEACKRQSNSIHSGSSQQYISTPAVSKSCTLSDLHYTPEESYSANLNSTYGSLLVESLTSSLNRAVCLVNGISALVSDEPTCLSRSYDLHNMFGIDDLKKHTATLHRSITMETTTLKPRVNQVISPDSTNNTCCKQIASNLAQTITQSAIFNASKFISSETTKDNREFILDVTTELSSQCSNSVSTSSTASSTAIPSTEGSGPLTDVHQNYKSKPIQTICQDRCITKGHGITPEVHSGQNEYGGLDVYSERMSNNILCTVMERAWSTLGCHGDKDMSRQSLSHSNDIQLHIVIQWIVASAMGCPCFICYTNTERKFNQITWISDRAHKNGWLVSDILKCILDYYEMKSRDYPMLFDVLQSKIKDPKLS